MSYITLGNLTRFLTKLKTYIGNNYLKKTMDKAGIIYVDDLRMRPQDENLLDESGRISFRDGTNENLMDLYAKEDVRLGRILKLDDHQTKEQVILSSHNFTEYAPSVTGTGATGIWQINISGNALNDSDGNKIVDTYAKKSDIPTGSNITVDDALSATSTNPVQNKVVNGALNEKLSTNGGMVHGNVRVLGNIKATSLSIGDVAAIVTLISGGTGDMAREQDGKLYTFLDTNNYTKYVPKLDNNGHLIINGSELWIA